MDDDFGWLALIGALALFLVGILGLGNAFFRHGQLDYMAEFVLAVGGLICFGTATLMTICYFGPRLVDILRQALYAKAETDPRIVLIEHLRNVDKDTFKLLNHYVGVITAIGGTAGPLWAWKTSDNHEVPYEFFRTFVLGTRQEKGRYWLPPIRTWGEGSIERTHAEELTAHFITVGLARAPVGHYPAEWIDFRAALLWTGLDEDWRE